MINFYSFDEKYKVNRLIQGDLFIKSARLKDAEKELLLEYLKTVEIVYDLKIQDGSELMIIEADCELCKGKNSLAERIARAIASSLPYSCLVVIRHNDKAKIFSFIEEHNLEDRFRSKIVKCFATFDFSISNIPQNIITLLEAFSDVSIKVPTLFEVQNIWSKFMNKATNGLSELNVKGYY